ncbi:MAG: hypothetical protein KG075_23845 [Alphaproteobacteria bacterium]|nr:hypothetical protein [Alphaproteobacteria bacterium]
MKKIYFAHCMADYGNERERAALKLLKEKFHIGWEIVNPSAPAISGAFQGSPTRNSDPMAFFRKLVQECDAVAFLFNPGGKSVGASVAVEVLEAFAWDKPVWAISIPPNMDGHIWRSKHMPIEVLSIEQTRALIARAA